MRFAPTDVLTRVLVVYSSVLTTVLSAVVLAGPAAAKTQSLDEIDVHRINVREPDGTLRLVISNRARLPGVIVRGQERPPVDRPQAGLLFYNDEGTENGGLVFGGHRSERGEVKDSGGMLTFDRYAGSQIVQLAGVHDSTDHIVGLIVSDTDDRRHRRVFVGHDREGAARVALMDGNGRTRISLQVASDGSPSLTFLDRDGNVVNQLGPKARE
jgi:hypothetical protein